MMETIKAIIFDMDGVIFDSETMYINDLIRFFKQHDIEIQVSDCIPLIGIDSKLYYEQATQCGTIKQISLHLKICFKNIFVHLIVIIKQSLDHRSILF